ncbi:hypothetical protein [Amycolatopsis sp. NPDC004079]|uniref:hypothetical protein n=1 Tax=Amycolatopsis sp. NPDC004079 TaxID=3154549 RepID=UPI0033AF1191
MEVLLIAILGAILLVKAAGGAAVDYAAAKTGHTPPSHERWQAHQRNRASRGEEPDDTNGYFRRRLRMYGAAAAVKADQKHAARMEHLREKEPANIEKHKRRIAAKEAAISKLCAWGGTTVGAIRGIPAAVRERQAHAENQRRDAEADALVAAGRETAAGLPARSGGTGSGVTNLVTVRPGSEDVAPRPRPESEMTDEQRSLVEHLHQQLSAGTRPDVSDAAWRALPVEARAGLLAAASRNGISVDPGFDPEAHRRAGLDGEPAADPARGAATDNADPDSSAPKPWTGLDDLPSDYQELRQYAEAHPAVGREATRQCQRPDGRDLRDWCDAVRDAQARDREAKPLSSAELFKPYLEMQEQLKWGHPGGADPFKLDEPKPNAATALKRAMHGDTGRDLTDKQREQVCDFLDATRENPGKGNMKVGDWAQLPVEVRAALLKFGLEHGRTAVSDTGETAWDLDQEARQHLLDNGFEPNEHALKTSREFARAAAARREAALAPANAAHERKTAVSNPVTTEITSLESAASHAAEGVQWAETTANGLETTQNSLEDDAASLEAQAIEHENAVSSLGTAGYKEGTAVIKHENTLAEKYRVAASAMRDAAKLLATVREQVQDCRGTADQLNGIFTGGQQNIAETVQANQQDGVADKTGFYENA